MHRATLLDWLARGRDGEQPYADFHDRVREAEGIVEETITSALLDAVENGHVGAMCFWLERRRAEEWGQRGVVTHVDRPTGDGNAATDLPLLESLLAAAKSKVGT